MRIVGVGQYMEDKVSTPDKKVQKGYLLTDREIDRHAERKKANRAKRRARYARANARSGPKSSYRGR